MKLAFRLAIVALVATPLGAIAAFGDNGPRVDLATPGIGNGAIERFTLRFNQSMVPLGDPRAAAPVEVTCPVAGQGRWVDQQTFVHEFATPLPGGVSCRFALKEGLRSLQGYAVEGQREFTVDSGGPIARAVLPNRYGGEIEEDQVFLVAANMPADPASVAANAYCAVDGVGEKIPVDVLGKDVPAKVLGELGPDRWEVQNFLGEAGLPQALPASAGDKATATAAITALKCRRPLPPGRDVSLVWGKGVRGAGGRLAGADQRFDFTVRKPFTARFECSRVNPQAGCNPVRDAFVRFTAPVPRALAEAVRIRMPDGRELAPQLSDEDKRNAAIADLRFKAPLPGASKGQLVIPAGIADESGRKLSNAQRFPLEVAFDAPPPLVKFAAPFGILERNEGGVLPVTVRNVEPVLKGENLSVAGERLRVDGSDGEIAQWLRALEDHEQAKFEDIKRGKETVTVNHTADAPLLAGKGGSGFNVNLAEGGKEFEVVGIPLTKPGFYVVELASPRLGEALLGRKAVRYVAAGALVTNMAVHFKWGRESSLAWVTALDTGQGVGDAEVRVSDSCTGQLLARGKTDASGRLAIPAGLSRPTAYAGCEGESDHPLIVSARKADDMSFTLTHWGQGIQPYDFDLEYGWNPRERIYHTVFDRALLRQGETIHMKHVFRKPIGAGFGPTGAFEGKIKLAHRGSDTSFELPLKIDANGNGETNWTAPAGAPMGDYDITIELPPEAGRPQYESSVWTGQSFRVDEYRLPTMKALVSGPKDAQVRPKSVPLNLFVGYLSGGGASNLPVGMRVGYFPRSESPQGYDGYSFGGREIAEGTKPLNGQGEEAETPLPPTQVLPLKLGADGTATTSIDVPQTFDQNTTMLVEMDYPDANGEMLTASQRIAIFTSGVQLGVKTDGWLMKQDDLRLRLVALDTAGQPLANQAVSVEVYSREILTARRRLIGGFYAYDNQMKTTRLGATCSATTDAQGLAQCTLDPGVSGEVYVVATTRDAAGNVARATQSVWLAGDEDWWFGGDNGDRMDVIPEKQAYKAGETARFQVRMPFRDATALVTVEREGVLSSFVVGLSGTDPVIEVPMPGVYAPDVYVSVLAVRGRVTGWGPWLSNITHQMGLGGSPEAAAATATVDLAKPAYRLGIAKVKVGWESHKLDVAVKADREKYAARDTANVALQVRNPDGTAAAQADVAFVAVDEALLQLAPNASWDVLTAMMGDRPISVLTSTAQMQVVGKRHYGRKAVEAGGGGGGDLSALNRENFQPVLLWQGKVPLDAQGRAQVKVPLSDALSAFRLVAVATNGSALFGTGQANVRTAQDLSIFSGIPTLARAGDRFGATFTLRNGSDKPMRVTANVDLSPRIATGRPLTVDIPAGGAVPVNWNLTLPQSVSRLSWTVSARDASGKAADKITVSQDVVPPVPVEVWAATLARVGTDTRFDVAPPAGALPGYGDVSVVLTDTLAPPLTGVRAYMAAYPYNCFEQRMSRAVATGDVAAWNLLASEMPAYIDDDGLLRYFQTDRWPGSEALTAYVLSLAGEAGLPMPEGPRARMIEAMKAVLDGRLRHEDYGDARLRKVAAFSALARQGAATAAMLGQLGIGAAEMPTATLADYLAALGRVPGLANGAQLRADAERTLRSRLVYEGTRIDLSDGGNQPWWLMTSGDEAAIKALLVTLGRPGWKDDAGKMMTGVAARMTRGHWDTTTANAWGTVAARKFMALYPADAIAGVTTATLGGTAISRAWPLMEPQRSFTLPLPAAATPLAFAQSGGAGPWALVQVRAAVPLKQPLMAGYRMTKEISIVQAAVPGRLSRGDVVKVTISVEATAERNWVVINDPVPAGATVIGDLGGQSQMLGAAAESSGLQPSYVERGRDAWRAYYGWVPRGSFTVSYVMRLNAAGSFGLPATRIEAMYSPEIRAQVPNQPVTVAQR